MLIGTAMVAASVFWGVQSYSDWREEELQIQQFMESGSESTDRDKINYISQEYAARFPILLSQLLNHGKTPWGHNQVFRKLNASSYASLDLPPKNSADFHELARLIIESNFYLELNVNGYSPDIQKPFESNG